MSSNGTIARVHYFNRQFLRTQDFTTEQDYHIAMRRRHNIAHHTWGIVYGLELRAEGEDLFILPGLAVDGYGRELVLARQRLIPTSAFVEKGSNRLEVWLLYNRIPSDQAPEGYAGCGDGDQTAASFYRWQEAPNLRLKSADPDLTDPRRPVEVPEGDLVFNPARTPPDDPLKEWPVFLGQVLRDLANTNQPYSVDPGGRPYAGLVGEAIYAPSGRARLQVGGDDPNDPTRFAVFIPEADPGLSPQPRLKVDAAGQLTLRGDATLQGNLSVDGGAIEFKAGTARAPADPPWRIYHVQVTEQDENGQNVQVDELRLEMAGGSGGSNQVVIGAWNPDSKQFEDCLTVDDNCNVTIKGDLVVEGDLVELQKRKDVAFSNEAKGFLLASGMSGIAGANVLFPELYFEPDVVEFALRRAGAGPFPGGVERIINSLAADPAALQNFASSLRSNRPDLAEELRRALRADEGGGG